MRCPSCATENTDDARFCQRCGTRLAAGPARQVRKTVTVVFIDMVGSTALGERLDPESMRRVMSRYFAVARQVVEHHGGVVEKFIGDAVMAVFGVPTLHEDDALRAVRAAADIRERIASLRGEPEPEPSIGIALRTGIDTGPVVAGDPAEGETLVTGATVNTAARLEQAAEAGEILLGEQTWRLVRELVTSEPVAPITAKGKALPVRAYRLLSVSPETTGRVTRDDIPMVGRERELERLLDAWRDVVSERSPRLFTVLGPAGVGKSRLIREFALRVSTEGGRILRGRCLPYGEGITFWPIAEMVRAAAGIGDEGDRHDATEKLAKLVAPLAQGSLIADRLASAIGLSDTPVPQEEVFWAIRKLFEGLAETQPLAVVVDDLHWAEPTLLEALEHIAGWSRDVPLLLVCVARRELLDARPMWGAGTLNATTMQLEALRSDGLAALVRSLLGGAVDSVIVERVSDAAEGNPLFVEHVVAMLREEGHIERSGDAWKPTTELASVPVPSTVMALISARLDRLEPSERSTAGRSSVVGRVFEQRSVEELTPEPERIEVPAHLHALVRKEFIRAERGGATEDVFRFRHVLIRDAAYEALPKAERAELHERFADWLEKASGDRLAEFEEIVGHHLASAYDLHVELGDDNAPTAVLGERAARHLVATGRRAFLRADMPAAVSIWRRAIGYLPQGSNERLALLPDLGYAQFGAGNIADSEATLSAAIDEAATAGEVAQEIRARLELDQVRLLTLPAGMQEAQAHAEGAIATLETLDDDLGLASAWQLLATASWMLGRAQAAVTAQARASDYFRKAGGSGAERRSMLWGAECYGPMPVEEAIGTLEADLAEAAEDQMRQTHALFSLVGLYAMAGRALESRESYQRLQRVWLDLGMAMHAAGSREVAIVAELILDLPANAEAIARAGISELERLGAVGFRTSAESLLSVAVSRQGRPEEALEIADAAMAATSDEDIGVQIQGGIARCNSYIQLGRTAEAVTAAKMAVAVAAATDWTTYHADAHMAHAQALHAAGRTAEARAAVGRAKELYDRKGNRLGSAQAEKALQEIPDPARTDAAPRAPRAARKGQGRGR